MNGTFQQTWPIKCWITFVPLRPLLPGPKQGWKTSRGISDHVDDEFNQSFTPDPK